MKAGMNVDEIKEMRAAWIHIVAANNIGEFSAGLLLEWWDKEPAVLAKFPDFAEKPLAELKTLPRVRSHGSHLFLAVTGILFNLEDDAVVTELLADLKRDHTHFQPTITPDEYLRFSTAFLTYVTSKLGAVMTMSAVTGFKKLLALLGSEGGFHD